MADTLISALTSAGTLDGTEIYPASQGGNSRGVTGSQMQTMVRRAGSATAGSWPVLGSGTLLSSEVAGAEEYDGQCEYFGQWAGARAVALNEYVAAKSASYTLGNNTNLQKLIDNGANGAVTLPTGLYFFDSMIRISSMDGTNTTNALIDLLGAGTAQLGTLLWNALGNDGAVNSAINTSGCWMVQAASPSSIFVGNANTNMQASLRGTFRVTQAGTLIPSIQLQTAAAAVVGVIYFRYRCMGSSTAISCGPWS